MKKFRLVLKISGVIFFIALTCLAAYHAVLHHQLNVVRNELRSKGEKLTIEELTPRTTQAGVEAGSNLLAKCEILGSSHVDFQWLPHSIRIISTNGLAMSSTAHALPENDPALPTNWYPKETN